MDWVSLPQLRGYCRENFCNNFVITLQSTCSFFSYCLWSNLWSPFLKSFPLLSLPYCFFLLPLFQPFLFLLVSVSFALFSLSALLVSLSLLSSPEVSLSFCCASILSLSRCTSLRSSAFFSDSYSSCHKAFNAGTKCGRMCSSRGDTWKHNKVHWVWAKSKEQNVSHLLPLMPTSSYTLGFHRLLITGVSRIFKVNNNNSQGYLLRHGLLYLPF